MRILPHTLALKDGRTLHLRSPEGGDAAAMLGLVRQMFRESWRQLGHPATHFDALGDADEAAILAAFAEHPRDFFVGAWLDGQLVGNANLSAERTTFAAHVGSLGLGVLQAQQGLGVGAALLDAVLREGARVGVSHVTLRVRSFNQAAIALYERRGFRRVGLLQGVARLPEGDVDEYLYQHVAT